MKIAIIGTGISGYGAYLRFRENSNLNSITFYNYGETVAKKTISFGNLPNIKLPEKKEFALNLKKINSINSKFCIRYSNTTGGLSDFWSGSVFPFTNKELIKRNLGVLKDGYKKLSKFLTISGNAKQFLKIYPKYYLKNNIKSINALKYIDLLNSVKFKKFKLESGDNRILNTANCIYCGNCFKGCENEVIFRPVNKFIGANVVSKEIKLIKKIGSKWHLIDYQDKLINQYDVIFLGLGTTNTIKLLINSELLDPRNIEIYDSNAIFFPLKINNKTSIYEDNFGFANKIIKIQSQIGINYDSQISIVPFNHFFSYSIFGKWIGNLIKSFLLSKFALGCFFSSAQDANTFRFNKKNQLYLAHDGSDRAIKTLKKIIYEINENNTIYKFLNLFSKSESSSHYSSNLLKNKNSFYKTCNYKENLFIIDGNMFPGKPSSQPNSFSIMAGAFTLIDQFLIKHKI
jgi:hypothetical protein